MIAMIFELREEIKELEREKRRIQQLIANKNDRLKTLEYLTVNQLDLFEDLTLDGSNLQG